MKKKFSFLNLKLKSRILIFDNFRKNEIENIFNENNSCLIDTRNQIYLNFIIHPFLFFKGLLLTKKIKLAYYFTIIELTRPNFVVSFVDNNPLFQLLDKFYFYYDKKKFFITIQNGIRFFQGINRRHDLKDFIQRKPIFHSNFFVFSQYDIDYYKSFNLDVKKYFLFGSIKLNEFLKNHDFTKDKSYLFDICIIGENWNSSPTFLKIMNLILNYKNFKKLKICICLKADLSGGSDLLRAKIAKQNVFKIFENQITYISNKDGYDTYETSCSSRVTIGTRSTILREMFSIGNIIYPINFEEEDFNIFNTLKINFRPSQEEFDKKLEEYLFKSRNNLYIDDPELLKYYCYLENYKTNYNKFRNDISKLENG